MLLPRKQKEVGLREGDGVETRDRLVYRRGNEGDLGEGFGSSAWTEPASPSNNRGRKRGMSRVLSVKNATGLWKDWRAVGNRQYRSESLTGWIEWAG